MPLPDMRGHRQGQKARHRTAAAAGVHRSRHPAQGKRVSDLALELAKTLAPSYWKGKAIYDKRHDYKREKLVLKAQRIIDWVRTKSLPAQ